MIASDAQFLLSISEGLRSAVNVREILGAVFRLVSATVKVSQISLVAFNDANDFWQTVAQQNNHRRDIRATPNKGRITPELRSLSSRFTRSAFVVEDYRVTPDSKCVQQLGEKGMRSGIHAFLHNDGQLMGGFFVQHVSAGTYTERDSMLVFSVARAIGPVLEQWDEASGATEPKAFKTPHAAAPKCSQSHADRATHIVGSSDSIRRLDKAISSVAPTEATALILGETGTGKELVARRIFELSKRRDKPYLAVNCAALSQDLIASELFGHVAGAFTGATSAHKGRFELADGGTLFLDEIGDLPAQTQVRLLRTLDSGEFQKVGGTKTLTADVRIIAATHRDLEGMVARGLFRADLFYRLNVFPIRLAPLRERGNDIVELVHHFLDLYAKNLDKPTPPISACAIEALQCYSWIGNVRELRNVVERAMICSNDGPIDCEHLPEALVVAGGSEARTDAWDPVGYPEMDPSDVTATSPPTMPRVEIETVMSLEDVIRAHILKALDTCGGKISGQGGAAEILRINSKTLESKMRKLGIRRCWS